MLKNISHLPAIYKMICMSEPENVRQLLYVVVIMVSVFRVVHPLNPNHSQWGSIEAYDQVAWLIHIIKPWV